MIAVLLALSCTNEPGKVDPAPPETVDWSAPDVPAPLRRLTGLQYQLTVRDLFPGAVIPVQRWVDETEVGGFENNAGGQVPSPLLVERVQAAAVDVTAAAMAQPDLWLPCAADGGDDPTGCAHELIATLGRRAFRRTLTDDELNLFRGFYDERFAETGDFGISVQLTLQAFLNSPEFLYLLEFGADLPTRGPREWLTGPELASRLSYFVWGSTPDGTLLDAAEAGELDTLEGVEAQAWRLVDHPRAADGVLDFHRQWLDLEEIDRVWLHYDAYPDWIEEMNPSMRSELETVVLEAWEADATFAGLLSDRHTDADPYMAYIYGVEEGPGLLPDDRRSGVLTRAGWLAAKAHMVNPSPVKRGVWVLDRLLCSPTAPPPPTVNTNVEDLLGTAETNRQRYEQHSADPACAGCHTIIDGIGFGFEHYDSMGMWVDEEAGIPVDATGTIEVGDLAGTSFDGALELSELLAGSESAHACYARHWYRYATGRTESSADDPVLDLLEEAFLASGGDIRTAIVEIVRSDAFRSRPALR